VRGVIGNEAVLGPADLGASLGAAAARELLTGAKGTRLLVTAAEGIRGWRRERRHLAGRLVSLGRGVASEREGLSFSRGGNLDRGSSLLLLLLLEPVEAGGAGLVDIGPVHLNSSRVVKVVLASHGVVVNLLGLLGLLGLLLAQGSLDAELLLHVSELLLLLIESQLLLSELRVAEVELLELLGSGLHAPKLLLEALLLLGQVHVGSDKLGVQVRVHVLLSLLINGELRGGQNLIDGVLLVHHRVVVVVLGAVLRERRLRAVVDIILAHAIGVSSHGVPGVLLSGSSSSGRLGTEGGNSRGLWRRPQTSEQVRAAGARGGESRVLVLALVDGIKREGLDILAATAGGQASRRQSQPAGGETV
jgi:hypothetical protein